ncbi:hypothetical protein ES708_07091 [subsurface metagenome]
MGSSSTPPEGVEGILYPLNDGPISYGVADKTSGETIAFITLSPRGNAARPRSCGVYGLKRKCPPFIIIGKHDKLIAETAIEKKIPVSLTASVEFTPQTRISNVVGTLPGSSTDEILFIAHLDTVYASPGANDNTASLITLLMLAHSISETHPKDTITFIASADEENGSHGMAHYVETRRRAGTLDNIKYSLNFDSVTWGPNISITTSDVELLSQFETIDADLNLKGKPTLENSDAFTMDNRNFKGTKTCPVTVGSSGYDNIEFCWHPLLPTERYHCKRPVRLCRDCIYAFS